MVKWIILFAAAYMLYRMFESEKRKKREKEQAEKKKTDEQLIATGELVPDPTCGTYVDKQSAISVRDGDEVHYFCSYECRDAFIEKRRAER